MMSWFALENSMIPESDLNQYPAGTTLKLKGMTRGERFFQEENGFGIYNFESEDRLHFPIKGEFLDHLIIGATYEVEGQVENYRGEHQLRIKTCTQTIPSCKDGIISYLQTLHGLKNKAHDIYRVFGTKSIDMLLNDPIEVAKQVPGIGKKSALHFQEQLQLVRDNAEVMVTLLNYGLTQKQAIKLLRRYPFNLLEKIQKNPYFLISEVKGFGFLTCDKIALQMGILPNNEYRIQEGILYTLAKSTESGNCFLVLSDLISLTSKLLSFYLNLEEMEQIAEQQLDAIVRYHNKFPIQCDDLEAALKDGQTSFCFYQLSFSQISNQLDPLKKEGKIVKDQDRIYLKEFFQYETTTAKEIARLASYHQIYKREDLESLLDKICAKHGYELEERQREAVIQFNLCEDGVYILTGSAGTGKTFTLKIILEMAELLHKKRKPAIRLLATAPTGKAAKVATLAMGMPCQTIHRALESYGDGLFCRGKSNPFDENFFICDETSMMDIELSFYYFSAIPDKSKVILLGDVKQLESVGPGNVLKDMIQSGLVPVIELNVTKRQGEHSGIIQNANHVIAKEMLETTAKTGDFYLMLSNKDDLYRVQQSIIQGMKRLLDKGFSFSEIQVLSPQRKGDIGVYALNYELQKEFNPIRKSERKMLKTMFSYQGKDQPLYIHKGDKVMHIKNNYDMPWYSDIFGTHLIPDGEKQGITNGEAGVVHDIILSPSGIPQIIVKYDEGYVCYENSVEELELCYATTIHKSQGSAWDAVILVISNSHRFTLTNNLLYTGITRARTFEMIAGDETGIKHALRTVKEIHRNTYLKERLTAYRT